MPTTLQNTSQAHYSRKEAEGALIAQAIRIASATEGRPDAFDLAWGAVAALTCSPDTRHLAVARASKVGCNG
jgi:hypothetical protein